MKIHICVENYTFLWIFIILIKFIMVIKINKIKNDDEMRYIFFNFITLIKSPQFKENWLMWWNMMDMLGIVMKILHSGGMHYLTEWMMNVHHCDENCSFLWNLYNVMKVYQCDKNSSLNCVMKKIDECWLLWWTLFTLMKNCRSNETWFD